MTSSYRLRSYSTDSTDSNVTQEKDADRTVTSIALDPGINAIADKEFYCYTNLTSVNIPDSVTTIGEDAFYLCTSLTAIFIPDSVTKIGQKAFFNCSSLTSIAIPGSVQSMGEGAFHSCFSLAEVHFDKQPCNNIGKIIAAKNLFYNCKNLTKYYI